MANRGLHATARTPRVNRDVRHDRGTMNKVYVHGYDHRENIRLQDQASTLVELLHSDTSYQAGNRILEAGCGAGRFTEIMLQEGANVYAVDVSSAVEANHQNCRQYPNYSVCQADIMALPFMREQFDIIVCIGVIQHMPSPENTITRLCSCLKPKGLILIDHYSPEYYMNFSRKTLRTFLLKRDARFSMFFCKWLVTLLWPFHQISWKFRSISLIRRIRAFILKNSPIVDYHDTYFEIEQKLLFQ
jgi:2-polyprenyl-3-methyl-5-hydroxy-6-metoxy-1,4-benzoquinol methylase